MGEVIGVFGVFGALLATGGIVYAVVSDHRTRTLLAKIQSMLADGFEKDVLAPDDEPVEAHQRREALRCLEQNFNLPPSRVSAPHPSWRAPQNPRIYIGSGVRQLTGPEPYCR